MKLRHDPYQVFRGSQTPAGLYARQKWLDEADAPTWQTDFDETVNALVADQMPDGSWKQSSLATIKALFGLHLTVRSTTSRIEDALNWLFNNLPSNWEGIHIRSRSDVACDELTGLPFVSSNPVMLMTGATLFLCSIFNRQHDPAVLAIYQQLHLDGRIKKRLTQDIAGLHNIFRALVVHPDFAREGLSVEAVARFADLQLADGRWGNGLPFFQTVNALAHLSSPESEAQLERAFSRLLATQHADGAWGRSDREWNTFLCIHALKNKGML
jgi:hypothetical protein